MSEFVLTPKELLVLSGVGLAALGLWVPLLLATGANDPVDRALLLLCVVFILLLVSWITEQLVAKRQPKR